MILLARLFSLLACLLVFSQPAFAAPALDKENLKAAMATRVNLIINERGQGLAPVTPDSIRIDDSRPVNVRGTTLYAVKLTLVASGEQSIFSEPDEMILLTDPTGTVQYGMVLDIATGEDVAMVQAAALTKVAVPSGIAKPFIKGNGAKDLIFVSDPFCPYCRQAYQYLIGKIDRIANFSFVHMPLAMHPGADAASWIMEYAREEAADLYRKVVDFAYSSLRAPADSSVPGAQKEVIAQFLKVFPKLTKQNPESFFFYLKGKYEEADQTTKKALQKLRITGTPAVIIDGQVTHGFDQRELESRLNSQVN